MWINVGTYIHDACNLHNEMDNKGRHYGLFTTLYSMSLITGALVITFGLSLMSERNYFILITGIAVFAFCFSAVFMKDIKSTREKKDVRKLSIKEIFLSTLKYYPQMVPVLGMIFVDGLNIGVQTSTLLRLIPITDDKKQDLLHAGFCTISSGVGGFFGGYLGGKLCDKFGTKLISTIAMCLNMVVYVLILGASFFEQLPVSLVVSFVFGFEYYFLEGCLMVICSRTFHGHPESFAIVKQFHCFSFVLYEVLAMSTENSSEIEYLMVGLMVLCIPGLMGIRRLPGEE